jgi:hypothetical protein
MIEKVLIYLGPTLPKEEALSIVPDAIVRRQLFLDGSDSYNSPV